MEDPLDAKFEAFYQAQLAKEKADSVASTVPDVVISAST